MRIATGIPGVLFLVVVSACANESGGANTGIAPLEAMYDFGVVRADQPTLRTVALMKPIIPPSEVVLAEPPSGPFAPAPGELPAAVDTGIDYALEILFMPTGNAPSAHEGSIHLRFVKEGGGVAVDTVISLMARTESATISLETPAVDFGTLTTGESEQLSIVVRNTSTATPVAIQAVSALPAGFSLGFAPSFPIEISSGTAETLWLEFEPQAPGSFDFELDVATTVRTLAVDVRADAVAP